MFHGAIFMVIMSWSSTADNSMITRNSIATRDAKSILFYLYHFEYAIYFSFGLITSGRTRASILFGHIDEICYTLTWSKISITFELTTFCINKLMSVDEKSNTLTLGITMLHPY
jgi:hypothetical protein